MADVLIVEDDIAMADLLQEALESDGYYVTAIARTAGEAITAVAAHQPDFAVIDIHLAKGELGSEVGACLRRTTKIGIIFSTGNDHDGSLTTLEGDAVLTKPYRLDAVGRGLKIIDELAQFGWTRLAFPRGFRLLH
jgi:CheY-like chemotaxis protein